MGRPPPLAGVMVMADVVVPPSLTAPESSRRAGSVVDKPISGFKEQSGSKSDGFGPVITAGEPFHQDSGRKRGNDDDVSSSRGTPTTTKGLFAWYRAYLFEQWLDLKNCSGLSVVIA